jgi:hypothetical protein
LVDSKSYISPKNFKRAQSVTFVPFETTDIMLALRPAVVERQVDPKVQDYLMKQFRSLKTSIGVALRFGLTLTSAQAYSQFKTDPSAKVALVIAYTENEVGTSKSGINLTSERLSQFFRSEAGWTVLTEQMPISGQRKIGQFHYPLSVENQSELPAMPKITEIQAYGAEIGVDFVCVGTMEWRVKTLWVGLGPKTKARAKASLVVVEVSTGKVLLDAKNITSDMAIGRRDSRRGGVPGPIFLSAALGIFSAGPKTPEIVKATHKVLEVTLEHWKPSRMQPSLFSNPI